MFDNISCVPSNGSKLSPSFCEELHSPENDVMVFMSVRAPETCAITDEETEAQRGKLFSLPRISWLGFEP
jgi:hypothetical protein